MLTIQTRLFLFSLQSFAYTYAVHLGECRLSSAEAFALGTTNLLHIFICVATHTYTDTVTET